MPVIGDGDDASMPTLEQRNLEVTMPITGAEAVIILGMLSCSFGPEDEHG